MSQKETFTQEQSIKIVKTKIERAIFNITLASGLSDLDVKENIKDLSAQDIIDKINDFLEGDPTKAQTLMFLYYVSTYPKSMFTRSLQNISISRRLPLSFV